MRVQRQNVTLATITFQNYFRMYEKLAGMTGTAKTEEEEFQRIYNLEVVVIPTNRDDGPRRLAPISSIKNEKSANSTRSIDEIAKTERGGPPGAGRHHLGRNI